MDVDLLALTVNVRNVVVLAMMLLPLGVTMLPLGVVMLLPLGVILGVVMLLPLGVVMLLGVMMLLSLRVYWVVLGLLDIVQCVVDDSQLLGEI